MTQPYLPSSRSSRSSVKSVEGQLEKQPVAGTSSAEKNTQEEDGLLSARLDELLASYLDLLEIYTNLRAQLSKEFSSGFLALAQANRNSNLGPGRRYGEEGFDQRTKASRVVKISEKGTVGEVQRGRTPDLSAAQRGPSAEEKDSKSTPSSRITRTLSVSLTLDDAGPTTKSTTRINAEEGEIDSDTPLENSQTTPASPPTRLLSHLRPTHHDFNITTPITLAATDEVSSGRNKDPLKWYGILIPPHLRQCQSHFTESVTETIPSLVSTISSMTFLESEIWSLRAELGCLDEYEQTEPSTSPEGKDESGTATPDISTLAFHDPPTWLLEYRQVDKERRITASGASQKLTLPAYQGSGGHSRKAVQPRSRVLKLE